MAKPRSKKSARRGGKRRSTTSKQSRSLASLLSQFGKKGKGPRRFKLPTGDRSLFIDEAKYPRLFEWVANADQ